MRRIRADAAAARLGQVDAFDGHAQEVARVLFFQTGAAMGTQFAMQLGVIAGAKVGAHAVRHQVQR